MIKHYAWDSVPSETLSPTISRRMISGERVMAAMVDLKKGAVVPMHSHESEQITYILRGALLFSFPDSPDLVVREGEVLLIPSNMEHAAEALEDTLDLDCFSPIRDDWLSGDDAYLRGNG